MDKDFLSLIFESRVHQISKITNEDKEYLSANSKSDEKYAKMLDVITNCCSNKKDIVLSSVEGYIEELNFESGYYSEKYYKQGFCDAVNFLKDIFQKN